MKDMERKNAYANIFGFLAGLTNSLSIIIMGVFTTHVTGAATNAGRYLGSLNVSLFELYIGLFFFFIIGSFFATILMAKKGFPVPILFAGALLIAAGVLTPPKIQPGSTDQFIFGFLVAVAMGAQNASTGLTPIGRTTHITGATTEFGISLGRMDKKNLVRLGSFILSFIAGTFTAFFLQATIGPRGFILVGVSLLLVAFFLRKFGPK